MIGEPRSELLVKFLVEQYALRNVLEQNFMDLNLHAVLLHSSYSTSIPFAGLFPPNEIQFSLTKNQLPQNGNGIHFHVY